MSESDKTQELIDAVADLRGEVENLKKVLANLLVMQKVIGATVEGTLDILQAKGLMYESEVAAINEDITEAVGKDFAGRG